MTFASQQFATVRQHDCRAETEALRAALARVFGDGTGRPTDLKPQVLFEIARLNKVGLFLAPRPTDLPPAWAAIAPRIETMRLQSAARNGHSLRASVEIARLMRLAGIAHVQFKGPLQQIALYGGPCWKPTGDVDLLVAEADLAAAGAVLRGAGYEPVEAELAGWWTVHLGEQHFRRPEGGPVIDLHHRLQQPGAPRPRRTGDILARATPMPFEDEAIPVIAPPDRCLVAAIGVVKALVAHEPCAGHLCDLRASLDRLTREEADALREIAAEQGLSETLALASHGVDALFEGFAPRPYALGPNPLPGLDATQLRRLLVTPWEAGLDWPRRSRILWALSGRRPLRFLREAAAAKSSELYRHWLEALLRLGLIARPQGKAA
ncbi:nucleotidyltransferase family protein [Cereibacter sphaeroides]|uniref:nucleotidyltransferase family protein n=1 Tax=Cereibacter sphaeroides TaxID=1063 RepID=UPI001F23C092|nr:nucleotidyltransferase family protein [Cereibacter sphaeroides]MCE6953351.1 nucleotidyltransferase family protein [Cereibacter sphaeroides]